MKWNNGSLKLSKKEVAEIEELLWHVRRDISYGGGGTFSKGDEYDTPDVKAIARVESAIKSLSYLVSNFH